MSNSNQTPDLQAKKYSKFSLKQLVISAMLTALICVMAQISIPVQPIPFTLSLFAIFVTSTLLTPAYAVLSILTYLLIGAIGLPVFANYKGGIQALVGPTGGFLMAYPLMAFITSFFHTYVKLPKKLSKTITLAIGMLLSLVVCYLFGAFWFTITNTSGYNFYDALTLCVFPFIPFDIIKIILAITSGLIIKNALRPLEY
ncbi:MAG: putative rane protein [Herbinix sp.]|jgi:biotin transport system substrate-specific component|nr:putative rane protein [Herbinix sp.]